MGATTGGATSKHSSGPELLTVLIMLECSCKADWVSCWKEYAPDRNADVEDMNKAEKRTRTMACRPIALVSEENASESLFLRERGG